MPREVNTVALSGKIVAFNMSCKGYPDGAAIEAPNDAEQVNCPKRGGHAPRRRTHLGAFVSVRVSLETDEGAHPVYRVIDDAADVSGTAASQDSSRHGDVNGHHLDDGTFVHLSADDEKTAHDLRVLDPIGVKGAQLSSPGIMILEARTIERQSALVSPARKSKAAPAKPKSLSV